MTEIRSIHGIQNEMADRGCLVNPNAIYIPYTRLTAGEMDLYLLLNEADVLKSAYPDDPIVNQVYNMYANSLTAGISRGVHFVGELYDPMLQQAAKNIAVASRKTAPASGIFLNRPSILNGIGIGEDPIYTGPFEHDCVQYATQKANAYYGMSKNWWWWENVSGLQGSSRKQTWKRFKSECETKIEIEKIVNQSLVNTSHHLITKDLYSGFKPLAGTLVLTKRLYHTTAINSLGIVTELSPYQMGNWVEAGVQRKNMTSGVGDFSSLSSSLSIAPDPEKYVAEYNLLPKEYTNPGWWAKKQKINSGVNGAVVVVGAVTALVTAIAGAVASAAAFQQKLNEKRAGALSTVQGFGSAELSLMDSDFNTPGGATSTDDNNNILLFGAAALGAYLLLSDSK